MSTLGLRCGDQNAGLSRPLPDAPRPDCLECSGEDAGIARFPLTELGRNQARRQADIVREIESRVSGLGRYASSLGRAQQTAEIAFGGGPFDSDPRLVEIDIGEFSGARMKDLLRSHAELLPETGWIGTTACRPARIFRGLRRGSALFWTICRGLR
ncbi:histidine phosphatase family protein [Paracoccus cavernae]|uniref:Histidine phosphatase family protein n=1 Tax=Paracoccus cavernae TaxID=1571207 RepID=A0ABT8D6H4_9RHOB|nr:histidine phosphatase family protein [Paracoccus cavernae]